MLELQGKYNSCKVFTDNVDNETISQLINLLNQPYAADSQIRIMPDTHAGAGCVIGTTMTLTDKVCANLVGVDLGCGMLALKLQESEMDYKKLDSVIYKHVPSGFDIHDSAIATSNIDQIYAPVDIDRAYRSLGTLGGGNHFIEVDRDEDGYLWLVIHTGSRHLGIEVCNYYQDLAYKKINTTNQAKIIEELKRSGRQQEIEQTLRQLKADNPSIPKDLCYVTGKDFDYYIHDMKLAQEHAKINRHTIANQIVRNMDLHITEEMDTIHNYIDTDHMILRKGSVSARAGEKLIIPMNMRDGSLICVGKGNPDWNYSAPHGAGRLMSRSQAKEHVSMKEFMDSMSGIYTSCVCPSTLDESPQAYKPMQEIIDNIQDTVEIVSMIKPVYNFKACELARVLEQAKDEDFER